MCYQDMKVIRTQRDNALREAEQLRQERDALQAQLAAVTRQRDAAVEALRSAEWHRHFTYMGDLIDTCPVCHNQKHEGHAAECKLAAALAPVRLP